MEEEKTKKTNTGKRIVYIISVLVIAILISYASFYMGEKEGKKQVNKILNEKVQKYEEAIDILYPKPPEEIYTIEGKVISKGKDYIIINTIHPDDYLPKKDPVKTKFLERKVNVSNETKIKLADYTQIKINQEQNSYTYPTYEISLNDIEEGETIVVKSKSNIKYLKEFTASEIIKSSL